MKKIFIMIVFGMILFSILGETLSAKATSEQLYFVEQEVTKEIFIDKLGNSYEDIENALNRFGLPIDIKLPRFIEGELIVKFCDDETITLQESENGVILTGIESVDQLNQELNVKKIEKLFEDDDTGLFSNIYKYTLKENSELFSISEDFTNDPTIEFAHPNYIADFYEISGVKPQVPSGHIPNDPYFDMQYALHNTGQTGGTIDADVDAPEAWDKQLSDEAITIAVIDTGVDYNHPELVSNMWINQGEIPNNGIDDDENGYIDDVRGWNFKDANNDPMDDHGHGTHCAGIIAAAIDNNLGIAGIAGKCKIMPLILYTLEDATKAVKYAADNGADVISMSFGITDLIKNNLSLIFDLSLTYADLKGVVLVAAAGNSNIFISNSPASHNKVIAVAATDQNDARASFSSFGMWVDVAAPGCDILSLRANGTDMYKGATGYAPGQYFVPPFDPDAILYRASGTSMSCPLVAGIAALVLSENPYLTSRMVRTILRSSVDPVNTTRLIGNGRINAEKAVKKANFVVAEFDKSIDNAIIDGIFNIKGTAKGLDFEKFIIEYSTGLYPSENSWTEIISSTRRVYGGTLYGWDTRTLDDGDGQYTLRLKVIADGESYIDKTFVIIDNVEETYRIDDDYNENTSGWGITKFNIIQDAINLSGKKDELFIHNGVYNQSVSVENRHVKITGESIDSTILKDNSIFALFGSIKVSNIHFDDGSIGGMFSSNNEIINNKFTNESFSSAIAFFVSSNNIVKNNILDNPPKQFTSGGDEVGTADVGFGPLSNDNIISNNYINNNGILFILGGKRNIISHNELEYVLLAIACHNNEIFENNITHGHPRDSNAIYIMHGRLNSIYNNEISDLDPSEYAIIGIRIEPDDGFAALLLGSKFGDSFLNEIKNNKISDCDIGILQLSFFNPDSEGQINPEDVVYTKLSIIKENTISDCGIGIYLLGSPKNSIFKNTIKNNGIGIKIVDYVKESCVIHSDDNNIYLNDFIDNDQQASDSCENTWYQSLLGEGNYWSDYTTEYPDAQIIYRLLRPDIYSIPYDINGGTNQDMFPLVNSYNNEQSTPQSNPTTNEQSTPESSPSTQQSTPTSEPSSQPTVTTESAAPQIVTVTKITSR